MAYVVQLRRPRLRSCAHYRQAIFLLLLLLGTSVLAATFLMMPVAIRLLRSIGTWDEPNRRSSHSVSTLRGAGLAPAAGALTGLGVAGVTSGIHVPGLLFTAAGFAVLGLVEDVRGVPTLPRFLWQSAIAALGVSVLILVEGFGAGLAVPLAIAFATIWVVGYVNVFNFMDGINGISAVHGILAGIAFGISAWLEADAALLAASVALTAGAAGFLPFNFPSGKVFLGDVGSYFFGAWIAAMTVLAAARGHHPAAVVAPLAIYLADTGWTLIGRVRRSERWWEAHRNHVYQRLVGTGRSHSWTTMVVGLFSAVCIVLGLIAAGNVVPLALPTVGLVLTVIIYLRLPRLLDTEHH